MRLFIAREALDPHLKVGAPVLNTQLPTGTRARAAMKAAAFYANWYPRQWLGFGGAGDLHPKLAAHIAWARRATRRLARSLFHAMARFGPKLEREQVLLGRFVDIGTELFAMAATCARAHSLAEGNALPVADYFCKTARLRIEELFTQLHHNNDKAGYRFAQQVLSGEQEWLERGVLK
jgi:hypothetical protein